MVAVHGALLCLGLVVLQPDQAGPNPVLQQPSGSASTSRCSSSQQPSTNVSCCWCRSFMLQQCRSCSSCGLTAWRPCNKLRQYMWRSRAGDEGGRRAAAVVGAAAGAAGESNLDGKGLGSI